MEKGLMKIKKGVTIVEGHNVKERGYCKRCALSLREMLKEKKEVEITALGSLAVANAMKTIAICTQMLKDDEVKLKLSAPIYKKEKSGDLELAIFSIEVHV